MDFCKNKGLDVYPQIVCKQSLSANSAYITFSALFLPLFKKLFKIFCENCRSSYIMNKKIWVSLAFTLLLYAAQVQAQATKSNEDPDADFKQAKELYQKEQYSLAYPLFRNLYYGTSRNSSIPVSMQVESKYYAIACRLKLDDATAADDAA